MIAGWDDAPVKAVRTGPTPKPVTMIYPYYCNLNFLFYQMDQWGRFPDSLREQLSLIIVDDGSPTNTAASILKNHKCPIKAKLFRIKVDVPWNWLAARNIAMHHADDGWCLGTDMDHVLVQESAEMLVFGIHDPQCIYRLLRKEHTGQKIHPHPNSWFMTREMFWKFGGYDEALSGHYGTDGDARRRWVATAPVFTLVEYLIRHEHQGDSSTTNYKRKLPSDAAAVDMLIKARGKKWKPKVLSFPYQQVQL